MKKYNNIKGLNNMKGLNNGKNILMEKESKDIIIEKIYVMAGKDLMTEKI